jgi:hypothetical protein
MACVGAREDTCPYTNLPIAIRVPFPKPGIDSKKNKHLLTLAAIQHAYNSCHPAMPQNFYRRNLPHLQRDDKPHFVTFCTYNRWLLLTKRELSFSKPAFALTIGR